MHTAHIAKFYYEQWKRSGGELDADGRARHDRGNVEKTLRRFAIWSRSRSPSRLIGGVISSSAWRASMLACAEQRKQINSSQKGPS